MTNDRHYDDFCDRLLAPYAERRGEVSGFTPLFGLPPTPGAMRTEEMWLTSVENGMQAPLNLGLAISQVRINHLVSKDRLIQGFRLSPFQP